MYWGNLRTRGYIPSFGIHYLHLSCNGTGRCSLQCIWWKHGPLQNAYLGHCPQLWVGIGNRISTGYGGGLSSTKFLHNCIQKTSKRQDVSGELSPYRNHYSLLLVGIYLRSHSSGIHPSNWTTDPFGDSLLLLLLEFLQPTVLPYKMRILQLQILMSLK